MAQLIHPNPNFIINSVKGWNSRVLYTYYGHSSNTFDYYVYGSDYTSNLFSQIDSWQSTNSIVASKGQYVFPQYGRFFKTGKSIRIKGNFLISAGNSNAIFNIRASIENITNSNTRTLISAQNNNNNHDFANNQDLNDVPVYFELTYSSLEDSNSNLYFQANGFYQYEWGNYNTGGRNIETIYVPIYNTTQFTATVGNINDEYALYVSFDNSSDISNIKLYHMTVEELT